MADTILEINDFDKLLAAIETMPAVALPLFREAMTNSLADVQDAVVEYPPATEANRPGRWYQVRYKSGRVALRPMGFYERGQGWWYPVMRRETLPEKALKSAGAMTAKRARRLYGIHGMGAVAGYKLRRTSEDLKESWTTEVTVTPEAVEGSVGTNTSYAEEVQGRLQAPYHAARQWKTVDTVLVELEPRITGYFEEAVDKLLASLGDKA